LRGETQTGVILTIGANNIRFVTSQGLELADFNNTNRPRNINISMKAITGIGACAQMAGPPRDRLLAFEKGWSSF
jgi:hypothetical protein